ncbi:ABC transporter permease protein [Gottschalkia acidurici 9a]|uniref:ABC transporter permease protein n=1 Tax=Gottschalkia acidurici (strain ATCC 7906 / DSM 604 / BCRC 14475 / CIP 104303 / KCTC 5404 / NCIMB 10678 / 9a) TaxID=1128398 RepID=K0B313_GOTA9|nr:FtsX-like permease family protein [Gottschalkia acidurici]AFS79572.1 ABC transporter permease protein [Gottschalkia acidurici 9a]
MSVYIKLALRYITSYKKRSIAMILAIALSSFLIVTVGSLSESARKSNAEYFKKTIGVQHVRYNNLNLEQVKKINDNKNVKTVGNSSYYNEGIFQNRISINLLSSDESMLYMDNTELLDGKYPIGVNEIALEKWVLKRLKLPEKLGQVIKISIKDREEEYRLVGIVEDREKSKAGKELEGYVAFIEENLPNKNYIYSFVEFEEDLNIRDEINKLAKEIGIKDKKDMKLNTMLLDSIGQLYSIDWDLVKTSLILMVTGGMVIYSLYSISVLKRIQEYGVMRAIGSTSKDIIYIMLIEILIIYTIGITIGVILSFISVNLFKGSTTQLFTEGNTNLNIIVISTFSIGLSSITSFIAISVAGIRGTLLALRVSPVEAITKSTQDNKLKVKHKEGFIEKVLGIPKKISYKNIMRNKKSFILTISAMSIGCVLFTYQSFEYELWTRDFNYRKTMDKSMSYDFILHLNPSVPIKNGYSKDQIEELKKLEGVKQVYAKQVLYSKFKINKDYVNNPYGLNYIEHLDHRARNLTDIEYRYIFKGDSEDEIIINNNVLGLSDSDLEDLKKRLKGNLNINNMKKEPLAILVMPRAYIDENGNYTREELGDVFNLKLGDKIKISIPKGGYEKSLDNWAMAGQYEKYKQYYTDKEFEIAGIISSDNISYKDLEHSHLSGSPTIIISEDMFKTFSGIDRYRVVSIDIEDDANYEYLNKKIQDMSELFYDTWMSDYTGLGEEAKKAEVQYNILKNSTIIVLIIISGLSIFNNINYNLVSRIREHGIMKAIGLTNNQFRRMIRFEGVTYGGISAIFSCTLSIIIQFGVYIYYAYYKDWLTLGEFFIDPKPYLIVILVNLLIGYIATIKPMRQVNKIEITEAIRIVE